MTSKRYCGCNCATRGGTALDVVPDSGEPAHDDHGRSASRALDHSSGTQADRFSYHIIQAQPLKPSECTASRLRCPACSHMCVACSLLTERIVCHKVPCPLQFCAHAGRAVSYLRRRRCELERHVVQLLCDTANAGVAAGHPEMQSSAIVPPYFHLTFYNIPPSSLLPIDHYESPKAASQEQAAGEQPPHVWTMKPGSIPRQRL